MILTIKQKMFSWFDSYDIYYEDGSVAYTVKGELAWGHKLQIYDDRGEHVATIKEVVLTWLPKFEIYIGDEYVGRIKKEFSFFSPSFDVDFNGWSVSGDFLEWDYEINNGSEQIADISKEFAWTDVYRITIGKPENALYALAVVLAIDAEKDTRSKNSN